MDLSVYIDRKTYEKIAGASWPSYHDFLQGAVSQDDGINKEIQTFISAAQQHYQEKTQSGAQIAQGNQLRQQQIFYNKNVKTSPCRIPWNTLGVNANGDLFICSSPSWIPLFIGNILELDDVYTALNSDIALSVRSEILRGRYTYCNNKLCSFFKTLDKTLYQLDQNDQEILPRLDHKDLQVHQIPKELIFDFDYTCNFKCPSCRTELINWNNDHIKRPINDSIVEKIKELVIDKIQDQPVHIRWAGGEPFISEPYLNLLDYIIASKKSNIKHTIQTNGSYLKSRTVRNLLPHIGTLRISFDAATEETYARTRVNGNWHKLLDNVDYIIALIKQTGATTQVQADFVVQYDNYKEIPTFVELCNKLGIQKIQFQKMWNWGTWPTDEFADKNVYDPSHPLYPELTKLFRLVNHRYE